MVLFFLFLLSGCVFLTTMTLFYQLLYIDAIDLTGLGISLPVGAFAINVWTKEKISELLSMDVQADRISYGKLPVTLFFFSF